MASIRQGAQFFDKRIQPRRESRVLEVDVASKGNEQRGSYRPQYGAQQRNGAEQRRDHHRKDRTECDSGEVAKEGEQHIEDLAADAHHLASHLQGDLGKAGQISLCVSRDVQPIDEGLDLPIRPLLGPDSIEKGDGRLLHLLAGELATSGIICAIIKSLRSTKLRS